MQRPRSSIRRLAHRTIATLLLATVLIAPSTVRAQAEVVPSPVAAIAADSGAASPEAQDTDTETPTPTATETETPTPTDTPTETPTSEPTATETPTSLPTPIVTTDQIAVTLNCTSDPEKVRVTNHGAAAIVVASIATLVDPIPAEPFVLNYRLTAGGTRLWQAGSRATGNYVLTADFILTNSGDEGVRVVTSAGTIETRCAAPPATATPTPTPTKTPTPTPTPVVTTKDLAVTLNCTSNPEKIRLTNNGKGAVIVVSIATLDAPSAQEPFVLNSRLPAGGTRLWQAGSRATGSYVLTTGFILTDAAGDREGVRVVTSVGTVVKRCAALPPPPTPTPSPTPTPKPPVTATVTDHLNLRTGPGLNYPVILVMPAGSTVTLTGHASGGYLSVDYHGTQGWAAGDYLRRNDGLPITGTTAVVTENLNLRAGPSTADRVLLVMPAGATVTLTGQSVNGFLSVRYQGTDGWAYGDYLSIGGATGDKWIEVDLSAQYLIAWQGERRVNESAVSTGRPGYETPTGTFSVLVKYLLDDMTGGSGDDYYYTPDVPWVMYFTNEGHALHGAYWLDHFGTPVSHGCVNLPVAVAEWLYNWTPVGTRIVIHA